MKGVQVSVSRVKLSFRISMLLILWWTASTAMASDTSHLLVLHSYHQGLAWTDAITRGIESRITASGIAVDIEYAYMDTKRVFSQAYIDQLAAMYAVKYAHRRFDAIIASDDHAFNFLRRYHQPLFADTPVVFCGVNYFEDAMLADLPQFTGVLESFDILGTLNLALTLQPRAGRLVVIGDQTVSGRANKKRFEQIVPNLDRPAEIVFIDDHTMAEVQAYVAGLGPEDIVIWLAFTTDRQGRFFSFEESTRLISRHSKAPMYSFWDFNLGHGIVGGLLISGIRQGEQAAGLALQILDGKPVNDLPVIRKSPNAYMFDYRQLKHFGIKRSSLPAGSRITNRPQTLFVKHRTFFSTAFVIFMAMFAIIIILLVNTASRKRAIEAMAASKNRYQNVFNSTSMAFFEIDITAVKMFLEQGYIAKAPDLRQHLNAHPDFVVDLAGRLTVKDVNPAAITLFKAPDKAGLVRALSPNICPDGLDIFKEVIVALADKAPQFIREAHTYTMTGDTLYVILGLNLANARQNYHSVFVSVFDITDRKLSEEALIRSEDRFRTVFDNAASGMALINLNGEYLRVNTALVQLLGYSEQEMLDRTWKEITHPDDIGISMALVEQVVDGRMTRPIEKRYRHKDGRVVQVLFNLSAIFNDAFQPIYFIAQFQDITPMKSLENQLLHAQKMEAIGTMAGAVAHDFNNLLMGIMGNTSLMLAQKAEGDPDHQRLRNIEQLIQSGSDLTRQLLGFAKGGKYEVQPIDLNHLIRSSVKMFARTHKEIEVETQLTDDLWLVEADRSQIDQVLYNLYLNAWQAMKNSGHLKIETRNCALSRQEASPYGLQAGRFVELSVTDDGIGMDAATRQQIFDPFFTTKERERGTGLGLASVYGIIKNHAGGISVESELDQGAAFCILLPASGKRIATENPKVAPNLISGNETILLVDDEQSILDTVGSMLNHLGYQVITAKDGQAAIDAFSADHGRIDLVILDMIMPGISGSEIFNRLKEIEPGARVLLCSGYSADGQAAEIISQGCQGFIQKPFSISQLSQKLGLILKQH